jgi:hypothetical protein
MVLKQHAWVWAVRDQVLVLEKARDRKASIVIRPCIAAATKTMTRTTTKATTTCCGDRRWLGWLVSGTHSFQRPFCKSDSGGYVTLCWGVGKRRLSLSLGQSYYGRSGTAWLLGQLSQYLFSPARADAIT